MQPVQARSEEPSLAEWQTEISKQQRELVALQAALPSSVNLGLTVLQLGKVSSEKMHRLFHLLTRHTATLLSIMAQ